MRSLLTRHFIFVIITLIFAVAGTVLISIRLAADTLEQQTLRELERERILFERLLCDTLSNDAIDSLAESLEDETGIRITVILPDGRVIADSEKDPAKMENHEDRPEIISAIETGEGYSVRYSETLKQRMVYSAGRSLDAEGRVEYVIRTSKPIEALKSVNAKMARRSIFWGLMLIAIAAMIIFISRRLISGTIETVTFGVKKIAHGDFSFRVEKGRYVEFQELEKSVNALAEELESMFGKLEDQRKNLLSILQSLGEGIIVLDENGSIMLMNNAAQKFTELDFDAVRERDFLSTVMIPELRELIEDDDIKTVKYSFRQRRFRARETEIAKLNQVVISINDITESYNIQQTKADFVSNVSHELKTPLTLIKGFAETLDMEPFEGEVKDYIATIIRHTDRMIALVKDLLTLSRIEQAEKIETHAIDLAALTEKILSLFKGEAEIEGVELHFEPPDKKPVVQGDESLLEIAISNLIDNAIKYTPEGGDVFVSIECEEDRVKLCILDTGIGIPEEDQQRIFERFYTVDKSRSNSLSGTGLGLSIVKHIVLLHSGEITMESESGVGSQFNITLTQNNSILTVS